MVYSSPQTWLLSLLPHQTGSYIFTFFNIGRSVFLSFLLVNLVFPSLVQYRDLAQNFFISWLVYFPLASILFVLLFRFSWRFFLFPCWDWFSLRSKGFMTSLPISWASSSLPFSWMNLLSHLSFQEGWCYSSSHLWGHKKNRARK